MAEIEQVTSKLKEIIKEHLPDINADTITATTTFDSDLNLGSLEMSTILMDIEDAFNIRIQDDEVESMKTVGDLVKCIVGHAAKT